MSFKNKILNGDILTEIQKIPDGSVDLVITSPPYNIRNSTGNGMKSKFKRGAKWNPELAKGYADYTDDPPHDEYVKWQRACLSEMMRVIHDRGAIFYNHKWRVQNGLLQDRHDIVSGFPVRQIIIWQRAGGINFNDHFYLPTYEVIYLIAKPDFRLKPGANKVGDVWKIPQERNNKHPAPFPEKLVRTILETTNAKYVLDPFCGSGTVPVVAKKMGIEYTGIELSKEYCDMIQDRLNKTRKEVSLFYE